MRYLLTNANVYRGGDIRKENIAVFDGLFRSTLARAAYDRIIACDNYTVFPGFADVHVHFREPGFSYKETIASGSRAAAHGGYTTVCTMPNLNPCPDTMEHLQIQLDAIERDSVVHVIPYGTITAGEKGEILSDMEAMAPCVVAFSDDGRGVQSDVMMRTAMLRAKALGKLIVAHCEDNRLLRGGYIHDGAYAATHGHKGICSESEWGQIARDLDLVRETGCGYHVCHISTKESVELIRRAKAEGLNVTCETAPHYLLLNDSMLQEDGRFKMNPPIRSEEDRQGLLEGLRDGTVDMIATDHAPHTAEEKSRGLRNSLMGVVGLETAFPLLYTHLVQKGELTLQRLVELLCDNPRRRFGLTETVEEGASANFTVFDLNETYDIDPAEFLTMGRSTPFAGWTVQGRCMMTVVGGEIAWCDPRLA
ncbi:MAG: dihydroorotase [Oscillospiraceae bacterium]|nr:dihydroorotase [Oscillospiraceae bacterium]